MQRVNYVCKLCGNSRMMLPSQARQRSGFCSRACMGKANTNPNTKIQLTCFECGKQFAKRRDHLTSKNFCSRQCSSGHRKNPSANWRDPEKIKEYHRAYREKNRERLEGARLERKNRNPILHRERKLAVQRSRRSAGGYISPEEWRQLKEKYRNLCFRCLDKKVLTLDHIIPLSKGGMNTLENAQPMCAPCNRAKSTEAIDYRPTFMWYVDELS